MLGKKNHVVGAVIVDGASDRSGGNQVGSFKVRFAVSTGVKAR